MGTLYRAACRRVLLPIVDAATGRSIARSLRFLEDAQWWPAERLEDYQRQQLQRVIGHAYATTEYYRRTMETAGLKPTTIRTPSDLARLPLLNKRTIRDAGIDQFLAQPKEWLTACSTSGSSGEQGTVYLSKEAASLTYAAVLLFFGWGGFALGDRHVLTGMTLTRGFEKALKDRLFRCHYLRAFDLSDAALERACTLLEKNRIRTLIGYASSLYCIASFLVRQQRTIRLDTVLSLGDMLYVHYRRTIESAFQCTVHDTYGCGEGFQIAAQCPAMRYHICMPLTLVEILDDQGQPVAPGEIGRVVVTRLDLNPMPLIRYEVGDLAAMSREERCPCGRALQMLDAVHGRDTDIVLTPQGHRLIVHFFTAIFQGDPRIRQFQVVQETKEAIVVNVVPGEGYSDRVAEELRDTIRRRCHEDLVVHFRTVDDIAPTRSGKRRFVVSHV